MLALCEYTAEERKVCMSKLHVCMRACVYARREEDSISTTLKVITLIKAVMCGDRGKEGRGERQGRTCHLLWDSLETV